VQWRQRLAGAAQQAMQAGKLSGPLARLIDHLLQPQLPWRAVLARYLSANARDDYNYTRPSRREGAAILPSLRSNQIDIVVALDTSGSISDAEIRQFVAEVDALKGQVRARLTLLACDAALASDGPWIYEPWEEFTLPREFTGGGGTDFRPVFDWLAREGRRPELLVYFTDAEGSFPGREPDFPVVWLVKGRAKVPWGQRIQLN
jgi:predicted metal-dependent peptidase